MKKPVSIKLHQLNKNLTPGAQSYRVVESENTTVPKIGEILLESQVKKYISSGYRVSIRVRE